MRSRLKITALAVIVASALGYLALTSGAAAAWKCEVHPERPTCTTLPPESTTSVPDTTTSVPDTSVPVTSTTTSTTVPVELAPPVSVVRPPAPPRLAG
jgi:hypothetical protein